MPTHGSVTPDLLKALNAGLQTLPTAFRAHQKTLGSFATSLLTASQLHGAVRCEAALLYSLLPRLTGTLHISLTTRRPSHQAAMNCCTWCCIGAFCILGEFYLCQCLISMLLSLLRKRMKGLVRYTGSNGLSQVQHSICSTHSECLHRYGSATTLPCRC